MSPVSAGHFERRDPLSDAIVTRAAACSVDEARDAVNSAARAFSAWSETPPAERQDVLCNAADLMLSREDEIIAVATEEIGSTAEWVRFNVKVAADMLRQTRELADAFDEIRDENRNYILRRRPAGVVLGIAPWNAAVTLATRAAAAPLACGNTVVLKGSELCPKTHEWVARLLNDAGLPPGALNFITNAPDHAEEIVEALIAHPAVRRVNFTGSTRVGRDIATRAARHLKPCLLELSGKGTMIVLADADLDAAADAAAHGGYFNQGQICMSTERLLVDDAVADEFARSLAERVLLLGSNAGNGHGPLGALISPSAAVRIRALIDDALAKGARLICGGDLAGGGIQPALLDEVSQGMRLYTEEAFGPVVGITRVSGPDEALSVANDTEFGLVTSIFSRNVAGATEMLRRIEVGIAHVNGSTVFDDPRMPFGGVKASGYGRFGGREAVHEFTDCQWIAVHD
ncbi:aldehyde dehydrogenase family protein [Kangsaoukella pontilimi]|uniref:aldehyde dehydrogenase family protein n=1 Tax=Kangsaoukella pontilimi TaxID=2691042 RepID=UPI0029CA821F|nr:aldehyde dehydrogenase family protein [Kangsaoukella pontilimi]